MARAKDSTIIIFDVGENASQSDEKNTKSFFENARDCIKRILERKIMSKPDDLLGIILMGTKTTKNNLAEQVDGAFTNIHVLSESKTPTWEVIRSLPEKPTKREGDWLEALLVAADYYKNCFYGSKLAAKKIVLMTNFQSPARIGNNMKQILAGFNEESYEVTVIGTNIYDENHKGDDIELAKKFVEQTNGDVATFDEAMNYLLFHRKKASRLVPWNVDLSFGPNVKIPVSVYSRIRNDNVLKSWQQAFRDPITLKASTEEAVIKKKEFVNTENQNIVSVEDTILGYQYGQKAIPFTDSDKSLLYKSGDKSLSLYGFTDSNNVKWQNITGNGVSYLFGRKGDKKAAYAVRCLIECLMEENLVGIVRRVYNNGNAPTMFMLSPVIDTNNYICLSLLAINYKEDIKNMAFPVTDIPKYSCTVQQVHAFKELMKAMNLMTAYDDSYDDQEAFPTGETVNPSIQYILDCMAFRAMNPGKPLPPPRDDITMLFKVPPQLEKKSRVPLDKLKQLFTLKKIDIKPKINKTSNNVQQNTDNPQNNTNIGDFGIPKIEIPNVVDEVTNVGTITPIEDFKVLHEKGTSLDDLSIEMIDVIETLVYLNSDDDYTKAFDATRFFRDQCTQTKPALYNDWLSKFKKSLLERRREDVLQLLIENKLNFITKDENDTSTYTSGEVDEDSQMYENNTIPDSTEMSMRTDANDFFDEM